MMTAVQIHQFWRITTNGRYIDVGNVSLIDPCIFIVDAAASLSGSH